MTAVMTDVPLHLHPDRLPEDSEQCESLIPLHSLSSADGSFCSWCNRRRAEEERKVGEVRWGFCRIKWHLHDWDRLTLIGSTQLFKIIFHNKNKSKAIAIVRFWLRGWENYILNYVLFNEIILSSCFYITNTFYLSILFTIILKIKIFCNKKMSL